jgi:hypothetical protein
VKSSNFDFHVDWPPSGRAPEIPESSNGWLEVDEASPDEQLCERRLIPLIFNNCRGVQNRETSGAPEFHNH